MTDPRDPFHEAVVQDRLVAFLQARHGADVRVENVRRLTAGFSWLTYAFDADWGDARSPRRDPLILRLGPPTGLFAPYTAFPQFVALDALAGSGVPVPRVHWYADDPAAFGAPFFICERVPGDTPLPWAGGHAFGEALRAALAEQFVGALAALHRFPWRGTPVEALDRGADESSVAMVEVAYWTAALRRWALRPYPMIEWTLRWLAEHRPVAPRIGVAHGDYRIGNFLERDGRITAILDWELVHVGDPHEDLGWMCMRAFRGRSPLMCHLLPREELYRRYEAASGMAVRPASVHFYEVFGTFKLLVIHLGAARCFEDGRFNDLRMPAMGAQIPRLLRQLEELIEERP